MHGEELQDDGHYYVVNDMDVHGVQVIARVGCPNFGHLVITSDTLPSLRNFWLTHSLDAVDKLRK